MQYKNLQSIQDDIEFSVDERLVVAAMKFNTSRLKTLLSNINVFANEIDKFNSTDKNELSNNITNHLRASYSSMCDAWKSMSSLEISQLPPNITTQYDNLNKAFATCGLVALNDDFNNFKQKVFSLSEEIKKKFDMFDKIVRSNNMLSKVSLENDGKALLALDISKIHPLQLSSCDSAINSTIREQYDIFKESGDAFNALFSEEAEILGVKRLVSEDKSINNTKLVTEKTLQQGLVLLDKLEEQYNSNNVVALSSTCDCFIKYKNTVYVGQLKEKIPHGIGRYNFVDSVFVGQVENGNMKYGVWTWGNNKNEYIGYISDFQFAGRGRCVYESGCIYDGEWKNGKWDGHGVYEYCGDKYEGEFKNGKRNGYGIYHYKNGDIFDGEWKDDKQDGRGTAIYYSSGETKSGTWANGILDENDVYSKYCLALELKKQGDLEKAILLFTELVNYKDSAEHLADCSIQKEYNDAVYLQDAWKWNDAIIIYKKIINYKDSKDRLKYCKKRLSSIKNYRTRKSLKRFFSSVFFTINSFFAKFFESIKKLFASIFSPKKQNGSGRKFKESRKRTAVHGSSAPSDVNKTVLSWIILICGILSTLFSAINGLLGVSILFIIICKTLTKHFKAKFERLFGKAKFGNFLSIVAIIVVAIRIFVAIALMAAGQTINFWGLFF